MNFIFGGTVDAGSYKGGYYLPKYHLKIIPDKNTQRCRDIEYTKLDDGYCEDKYTYEPIVTERSEEFSYNVNIGMNTNY